MVSSGSSMMITRPLIIFLVLCKFGLCRSVCPEWCECVSLDEGMHYLNCQWPHIPDAQVFLSFPIATVTRLTIKCNKDSSTNPRSKFSSFMFEKFSRLKHLSIENCHSESRSLPKSFANGLNDLRTLNLFDLSLKHVEPSSLADMKSLEKLTISSNLTNVPRSEFCHLKDMKYLNLSHNHLSSFDDVGYTRCEDDNQIVIMDLENNRLSKIETNSLHQFRGMRILRLSRNSLREIPSKLFDTTFQLKELYLDNNQISVVDDLPANLTVLDLSKNDLHMIPPTLARHTNLHKLNLSRNSIDANSPFAFDDMHTLIELDLSFNRLQNVQGKFFGGLRNLTDLRLNDNDIRHLESRCFANLTRLKRLNLSNNKISNVKRHHFDGMASAELIELNLRNNTISSLDGDVFAPILNLNSLIFSANWLLDVPAALYVLSNLRDLDLSQNKITKIRKFVLDNLTQLRRLNLSNNKITSLERYLFGKMKNLKRLDLSYNSIEVLQANYFVGADSLEEIFLQQNFVKNIAKVFSSLSSLRVLNVSENRIEKFELDFLPRSTTTLHASHNQISRITCTTDGTLFRRENESNLRIIDFSFNFLTGLDGQMLPDNLEYVNLSYNSINVLSDDMFYNKTDLTTLDLRNNFLTNVNLSSLTKEGNSKTSLYISGNRLICTCKLQWLVSNSLLTNGHLNVVDYESLSCSTLMSPTIVRPLASVQSYEFLCNYKVLCIDTCLCCEFDVCDCKNVCPDDCQCYNDAQNSLNVVKCPNQTDQNGGHFKSLPMYATVLYLDGGNVSQLQRNTFFGRYRLKQLFVNASSIHEIKSKAFSGLTSLELLDLSENSLDALTGDEFYNTPKLEALFLNNNRLQTLGLDAFVNLPNLKILTLHNNLLQHLPEAIIAHSLIFTAMTLAGNPWKCDCDNRYNLQIWLPRHKLAVTDHQQIYCYENLTQFENSTVLSLLPPTLGVDVVKVNFWTFTSEINKTFCYPASSTTDDDKNMMGNDHKTLNNDEKLIDSQDSSYSALLLVAMAASGLVLLVTLSLIVWKCRKIIQQKSFYNKYSAAPSVNSSNTAPTSGSVCNSPVPLLQYKIFVSYSKSDENFVVDELLPILEQTCQYSQICLLHRDFPSFSANADHPQLVDDILKTMERSVRVITVVSSSFIKNDWCHLNVRPAYQYLLRYKHCKMIMVVLDNLPQKIDSMLAHYIRTNRCISYNDPLFWQKLIDSVPSDDDNGNGVLVHQGSLINDSSNYSELYGTIVPSRFV